MLKVEYYIFMSLFGKKKKEPVWCSLDGETMCEIRNIVLMLQLRLLKLGVLNFKRNSVIQHCTYIYNHLVMLYVVQLDRGRMCFNISTHVY